MNFTQGIKVRIIKQDNGSPTGDALSFEIGDICIIQKPYHLKSGQEYYILEREKDGLRQAVSTKYMEKV
jgi:hypothetical protein